MSIRTWLRTLAVVALAMLPTTIAFAADDPAAHGAEAGGKDNPLAFKLMPYIATIVVFGIVYMVLQAKVWPVILKALNEREAKIKKEITDAEAARKQAAAALNQYEQALAEARTEAAQMLESTKAEQQKMAAELKRKAEADITAMKDAATRDIESAKRAAISEVYAQMSTTATSIASKIIQRELNADDQARLVEDSLAELHGVAQSN